MTSYWVIPTSAIANQRRPYLPCLLFYSVVTKNDAFCITSLFNARFSEDISIDLLCFGDTYIIRGQTTQVRCRFQVYTQVVDAVSKRSSSIDGCD